MHDSSTMPSLWLRGFFRNPSPLTRYGQDEWYPRRDPTTRLAALGRGADTQS